MNQTLQEVKCPFCSEVLYRRGQLDASVWGKTKDSPPIQNDASGNFIICPHCFRRVAMERTLTPVGTGFQVSEIQKQETNNE
jgi:hypothetical protein